MEAWKSDKVGDLRLKTKLAVSPHNIFFASPEVFHKPMIFVSKKHLE